MKEIPVFVIIALHLLSIKVEAQASGRVCQRPQLDNGFVVPEQEIYQDGVSLTYACDRGLKTPLDGWWGKVKCDNGVWSHNPQCIKQFTHLFHLLQCKPLHNNCWFSKMTVEMDQITMDLCHLYLHFLVKHNKERKDLCVEPPQVNHAVITQDYQNKFLSGSKVVYKCQTSYTLNGSESIVCISGEWTPTPTCTSGRVCQRPQLDNGFVVPEQEMYQDGVSLTYACDRGLKTPLDGRLGTVKCDNGVWSHNPQCNSEEAQRPTGRPEPSGSGPFVPVEKCGEKPVVDNGDYISDDTRMALTYKCNLYYKLEGPEKVMCHSNGVWSETPVCKEPCTVSPTSFDLLDATTNQYVMDGGNSVFLCKQKDRYGRKYFSYFHCQNGKVTHTPCTLGCRVEIKNYPFLDQTEDIIIDDNKRTFLKCRDLDYWKRTQSAQFNCLNGAVTALSCAHYG